MRYIAQNTPHGWWVLRVTGRWPHRAKVMAQGLSESAALAKLTELRGS